MKADELHEARKTEATVYLKDRWQSSIAVKVLDGPVEKIPYTSRWRAAESGRYWVVKAQHWNSPRLALSRQLISQAEKDRRNAEARRETDRRNAEALQTQERQKALGDRLEAALATLGIDDRPSVDFRGVHLTETVADLLAAALLGEV